MPRKAKAAGETRSTKKGGNPDSISGYFREIFKENPHLLKSRSNEELARRWLADHPSEKELPNRVRYILTKVKSLLRHKRRKKAGRKKQEQTGQLIAIQETAFLSLPAVNPLEQLEEEIDECLTLARTFDQKKLASIISLLRRARNEVVWKLGE